MAKKQERHCIHCNGYSEREMENIKNPSMRTIYSSEDFLITLDTLHKLVLIFLCTSTNFCDFIKILNIE